MQRGIDVSYYNGSIDWNAVRGNGIEFAIIRAGFGMYDNQKDRRFDENYSGATAVGLPVGAYWYSYAKTVQEAEREADTCLRALASRTLSLPVYFDIEDKSQENLSREQITSLCTRFCEKIQQNGYRAGVYANTDWFLNRIDIGKIDEYSKWLADYRQNYNTTLPRDIHQYTSSGRVAGINGAVDLNNSLIDFSTTQPPRSDEVVVEVTVDTLIVRNCPSVYGGAIGRLRRGDPAQVLNDLNGGSWIQIAWNTTAYIARQYTTGANGSNVANDPHVVGVVTANDVALRNLPDKNSPKLATLSRGDLFDVADDRNGDPWIYIRYRGINGYIARQYTNGANGNNVDPP